VIAQIDRATVRRRRGRTPLNLVALLPLMKRTTGRSDVVVGLLDGPVAMDHPDLVPGKVQELPGRSTKCKRTGSAACRHGTFVAGILSARRGSMAPAICPGCTLLVRPIFVENEGATDDVPATTPQRVALAIVKCVEAGAHVLNISAALRRPRSHDQRELKAALDFAQRREVIVVAAAGNEALVGGSALTRHPWVVPVVGCDRLGRPMSWSNLGGAIGRWGLGGPGEGVTSLSSMGMSATAGGTSVAAPFVAATVALLMSMFPDASGSQVRFAITHVAGARRRTVVPPLLDAWGASQVLAAVHPRR
jgi:subtilisin family serine protease